MEIEVMLIRHGKTRGNLEGRYVGRTDEPLLPGAVEELAAGKDRLAYEPEWVFVSPLVRCRQTAEILFDADADVCPGLVETDFGAFEYKNYEELNGDPAYQAWIDSGGMSAFPGGEAGADFRERCRWAFLECMETAETQGLRRVAFVVHGGTIMSVMEAFALPKADFYSWQPKNGRGFWGIWNGEHLTRVRAIGGEE